MLAPLQMITCKILTYYYIMQRVKIERGQALADEFGIKFFETSAKLNLNVDAAFLSIAKDIVERLRENPEHYGGEGANGVNLQKDKKEDVKAKSCC